MVFTKDGTMMNAGFLSRSFLEGIGASEVKLPLVC